MDNLCEMFYISWLYTNFNKWIYLLTRHTINLSSKYMLGKSLMVSSVLFDPWVYFFLYCTYNIIHIFLNKKTITMQVFLYCLCWPFNVSGTNCSPNCSLLFIDSVKNVLGTNKIWSSLLNLIKTRESLLWINKWIDLFRRSILSLSKICRKCLK